MLAGRSLDIFDDLLARASAGASWLSHVPLLSGYDEPRILSYQIALFGPISADVSQLSSYTERVTLHHLEASQGTGIQYAKSE